MKKDEIECGTCHEATLRVVTRDQPYAVGTQEFSVNTEVLECPKCGGVELTLDQVKAIEQSAALYISEHGPATGKTFRFLRKAAKLQAKEVADLLNTSPETVSRWENGERDVDELAWTVLSYLAHDAVMGVTTTRDRLAEMRKKPAKVVHLPARLKARAKTG